MLTVSFAAPGRKIVGLDPSAAMIDYARRRPGAEAVEWIHGSSTTLKPYQRFDLAVMTGNVAQHIADPDWERTLYDVRRALIPGGVLAFESRNPARRAWDQWAAEPTTRETPHGSLREWMTVKESAPGTVVLTAHTIFESTGEHVTETLELHFRDANLIVDQLNRAGFHIAAIHGDWGGGIMAPESPIMVFVARNAAGEPTHTMPRRHAR